VLTRQITPPKHARQAERRDPPGVLAWHSAAERNKLLIPWRLAVSITFAEQPRCLRVAWVLHDLFNARTGFCNASNPYLAKLIGLPANKVQEALDKLDKDGAIRRLITPPGPGSNRWRAIYPATEILSVLGEGSPLPGGVTGNPQQPGVQTLRRRPRIPRTEIERARLAAGVGRNGSARDLLDDAPAAVDGSLNGHRSELRDEAAAEGSNVIRLPPPGPCTVMQAAKGRKVFDRLFDGLDEEASRH
jgi:hypothetical protein